MSLLVALHGFTGEGADFEPLRSHLPPAITLVAPDLPGHGRRQNLRAPAEYSITSHLDLISAAATEPTLTLLGYSMGGRLALHWAIAHPGRVRRLILVGSSPGLATPAERAERRLADAGLADFIRTRGLAPFLKYWHLQSFFQPLLALPPDQLAPILARRQLNDPAGLALSLDNVGTAALPSLWHRLGELRCPVELVTGEADLKFTRLHREMGAHLPKARLSVIEGAGHAVHLERPGDLAMVVG